MKNFEYAVGTLVDFKCGDFTNIGRIEGVRQDDLSDPDSIVVVVSDGVDLYNVKPKDITKAKFDACNVEPCKVIASVEHDPVNHPSHYTDGKIEVIDFINDKKMNFNRGNVIKYVSRAGKKASKALDDKKKEIQDLEKAKFYLEDEIKRLKQQLSEEKQ